MKRGPAALLGGVLFISSVGANAAILDFDEFNGNYTTSVGTYESNGFRITGGSIYGIGSAYDGVFTTGALLDNAQGGLITLQRIDGGSFSLNSTDMTRFPGYSGSAPIDMLAFDASNIQIDALNFTLPDSTAFNTYSIGFTDVYKVTWAQAYAYHAFDNVVLDDSMPMPEPASLILVGLGLAGISVVRRMRLSE